MIYDALLLVAGQGQRMKAGCNKVFLELDGQPVFVYSLSCFLADTDCQRVVLVGRLEEREHYLPYLSDRVVFVAGGAERQDSVRLGLEAVTASHVMVHDGARPFVNSQQLQDLKGQPNSILAVPAKDTIKKVSRGLVQETLPREQLYQVQTPQFFETDLLKEAHQKALVAAYLGTDDASLVERFSSSPVAVVPGSYSNLKLTTPEDMLFAESILKNMKTKGKK